MPRAIVGEPFPAGCLSSFPVDGSVPLTTTGARDLMRTRAAAISVLSLLFGLSAAAPALAQYGAKPMSDRATGETYHVEIGGFLWNPGPDIVITSEALGIIGSKIDFVTDLGIEKSTFRQLKLVLRPAT